MNIQKLLTVAAISVSFLAMSGGALANDKAKKQAEIREKAHATLNDFYSAKPEVKAEVENAAGYAVFTTYGLSFIVGGAGGSGLAHDNKTKKETFMSLAQASAGAQIGASDTRYLFVFSDHKALQQFIDKGWTAGATAAAGAGTGGDKAANVGAGAGAFTGGRMYMLTKAGFQAGGAAEGTKAWKDKKLN
jgi:lipid-binding SYLF domain-containing protein